VKVDWSDRAVEDLSEIRAFIAEDSETSAIAQLERIFEAVDGLAEFPDRGRRVPEAPELRELLVDRYRVIYRRFAMRVEIVLVIHGRRNLAALKPATWR
jgi:plasmid stabilization system protein ParE